jgi:hypothetical protein
MLLVHSDGTGNVGARDREPGMRASASGKWPGCVLDMRSSQLLRNLSHVVGFALKRRTHTWGGVHPLILCVGQQVVIC